jgi:hypothetical protein
MLDGMRGTPGGIVAIAVATSLVGACVGDSSSGVGVFGDGGGADANAATDGAVSSPDASASDAAMDASSANDASTDAATDAAPPACDTTKPFAPPLLIAGMGINVAYNSSPHLSADERTMIFFGQLEAGAQDEIYLALRADPAASFGAPAPQTVLDGPTANVDADLSANALTVFFSSDRSGQYLIYSSTRATTTSAWAMPAAVTAVNAISPYASYQPFVTADGQELWLASNRPNGSGQDDLYHAPANGSTFGAPVAEAELNTSSVERSPVLSADRKSIFWASDRTDGNAKGGFDIWFAQRASVTAPFTAITNVAELNSTDVEYPGWLSADGCRLYMTRSTGTTPSMYVATRPQ